MSRHLNMNSTSNQMERVIESVTINKRAQDIKIGAENSRKKYFKCI